MTYASEVAADSPVLWWRLGEASGTTAADASGNGRDGTYVGSPTLGVGGLVGDGDTAVGFDGVDDYVSYSGSVLTSANAASVEAWVSAPTVASGSNFIFDLAGTSQSIRWPIGPSLVDVVVNPSGTGTAFVTHTSVSDGTRHHIVVTYSNTTDTATVYVDGSSVATGSVSGTFSITSLMVARQVSGGGYATATIDEFAVYGVELSSARVAAHYAAGAAVGANEVTTNATIPPVVAALDLDTSRVTRIEGVIPTPVGPLLLTPTRLLNLDGTIPTVVGGLTLDNTGTATLTAAGAIATPVAAIALVAGVDTQTNRAAAWVRDNIGEAQWTPTVATPTTTPPAQRVIAQAFTAPTIDGTHTNITPTYAEATGHRDRIVINGRDITYFRGAPTPTPDYQWVQPLGYGTATIELPQAVVPFETPGAGDLSWLTKGAKVLIQRVDNDTNEIVATDWRGIVIAFDISGNSLTVECGGDAVGRAALQDRQMMLIQQRPDAGDMIARAIRRLRLRHDPVLGTTTGIRLARWGGGGMLDFINELTSKMTTVDGDQWTVMPDDDGVYHTTLKDLDTIHGTVYLDDARIRGDLRSDLAEEPNRIYASGVTRDGMVVKFGAYPGLVQAPAPPYPFNDNRTFGIGTTDADTDSGDGITVMGWRLRATGYLETRVDYDSYDAEMAEAIRDLKREAKLQPYSGDMTPNAWRALFDLSATGYSLRNIRIMPAAATDEVTINRVSSNGSIIARNPAYDPTVVPVDRTIAMGAGFTRNQIRKWARNELATTAHWRGTIEINTGAIVEGDHTPGAAIGGILRARDIRPGMNLSLPLFAGGIVVHVAGVSVTDGGHRVTLAVDTRPGDTLPVWAAIQRDRENRDTIHRAFIRQHRASSLERENTFDEVGGVVEPIALDAGWTVFPVVAKQAGTIEKIAMRLNPEREFALAVFGRRISVKSLRAVTNAPLTVAGSARWTSEAMHSRLDSKYVMLYVAGSEDDPCGYFPGRKSEGASLLTGRFEDAASFPFVTFSNDTDRGSVLWVAVWVPSATTLQGGRIMWPSAEDY